MNITVLKELLAVCRLPADAPLPKWLDPVGGPLVSVTRSAAETSIICQVADAPQGVPCHQPWRALRVAGPLDFGQIGILAELTTVLAAARVSVFAMSTFDTDYLLVEHEQIRRAVKALRRAGHQIVVSAGHLGAAAP